MSDPEVLPGAAPCGAAPFDHLPVLAAAVQDSLADLPPGPDGGSPWLLDGTLGGGGHSALLLSAQPSLQLIGLDQDPTAREAAARHLAPFGDRVRIIAANFGAYDPPQPLSAILVDLGVSSPQLDVAARGFSFRLDGPLDMRMNPDGGETAAELLDRLGENELADLLYAFGDERFSRRIARRIVERRPWSGEAGLRRGVDGRGTAALAYLVAGCYPPAARRGRLHPATRCFQALRIAINAELAMLEALLRRAPDWLVPGGLLAVISFHSLEDRRVKTAFLQDERLERVTRKALMADANEIEANPRSRSARLRVARRLAPAEAGLGA
ncbi:MAG: 16S rRNA (cytosine(1402)-N(4))-methyltransferase RsmH [Cyanobacteriota bacterium]